MNRLREHRLLALFCAGLLLFNFPLLALWDRNALLLGVPLFPAALFIVWALLIGALACIVEGAPGDDAGPDDDADPGATGGPRAEARAQARADPLTHLRGPV